MPKPWSKVKIGAEWTMNPDFVQVGEGYVVPRRFTASATSADAEVNIDVEVTGGRAHARRVSVSRDPDVPIRDVIAWGVIQTLHRVEVIGKLAKLNLVGEPGEVEIAVVKKLVGYVEVRP